MSGDADDGRSLEALSREECDGLLASRQVGRLGVRTADYPLIFVVNYGLIEGTIFVRVHPGTMLTHADGANVAFEVDEIDYAARSGWSVLVLGLAEEMTDASGAEMAHRSESSGIVPWAPGDYGHWLRLIPRAVSGRRIIPGMLPPAFPDSAYL